MVLSFVATTIDSRLWRRARRLKVALTASLLMILAGAQVSMAQDYLLAPQDTVKLRVFEWRPSSGTSFEWVPLTGEFVVSAAGNLSLPLIGNVPVAGKTTEQISQSIGERLQSQVGLQRQPNVSVEISSYRPFFVTGLVATPGKYLFTPGMTVVQAVSMAGGVGSRDANLISLQRDALSGRGDIRALRAERLELLARQARIDAIINGTPEIAFPAELVSKQGDADLSRTMDQEKALFDTRNRGMQAEIDSLNQTKVLTLNQIDGLKEKALSLAKQIDLAHKELGSVDKLVTEGLTVSARRLGANQEVADLESRNLDVSLAILKAQQDLAKIAQDISDVRDRYRIAALTEAAELRERFSSNAVRMKTATDLLSNLQRQAPSVVANLNEDDDSDTVKTTVTRVIGGVNQTVSVADNDPIEPGDVIRVERPGNHEKQPALANSQ